MKPVILPFMAIVSVLYSAAAHAAPVEVSGCVEPGVEGTCLMIRADGQIYNVTHASPTPKVGEIGTVRGTISNDPDICQQGILVAEAEWRPDAGRSCRETMALPASIDDVTIIDLVYEPVDTILELRVSTVGVMTPQSVVVDAKVQSRGFSDLKLVRDLAPAGNSILQLIAYGLPGEAQALTEAPVAALYPPGEFPFEAVRVVSRQNCLEARVNEQAGPCSITRPAPAIASAGAPDAGAGVWIWRYDGTLQCGMGAERSLADDRQALEALGVRVNDARKRVVPLKIISMCGAPTGRANSYLISASDWNSLRQQAAGPAPFAEWTFDAGTTKVFKHDGTLQCGFGKEISLDEMALELEHAGIAVLSKEKGSDGLVHPAVCGASTGRVNIYTIDAASVADAQVLGFTPVPPAIFDASTGILATDGLPLPWPFPW